MKNKEIEELLNKLKNTADTSFFAVCGSEEELDKMPRSVCKFLSLDDKQAKLLLSYIEQLEKENDRLKEVVENLTTMTVNGDAKQIKNTAQYKLEQLENRNKELYEGFMATQEELTDYATKNEQLEKENKILRENAEHNDKVVDKVNWKINILKNNRDKAIEYINDLRDESAERQGFYNCFPDDLYIADIEELLTILKGDSDE